MLSCFSMGLEDILSGKDAGEMFSLMIPGSTCNLGPGLDTIGLALEIQNTMTFQLVEQGQESDRPVIKLQGEVANQSLPEHQNYLIETIINKIWQNDNKLFRRLQVTIRSDVPLGSGLGNRTATIIGALWAYNLLKDSIPTAATLLAEGCAVEGHPESLAASLYGGLAVCTPSIDGSRIVTQSVKWPDEWRIVAIIPKYTLVTKNMRDILPKQVTMEDAIANMQRVAYLVAAVSRVDESAMKESLHDRLHEPYREKYVPELAKIRQELENEPILGCALSGAGSSSVVFVHKRNEHQVLERLEHWSKKEESIYKIMSLRAAAEGVKEVECLIG